MSSTSEGPTPTAPDACPSCGGDRIARVSYGLSGAGFVTTDEDELVYEAGCMVPLPAMAWACPACDHTWAAEDADPLAGWNRDA